MILAETDLSFGSVLLYMLWFFFLFMIIMIWFQIIVDLFRDHEESGGMKVIWVIFLVLFPPITMLVYLVVRGSGMAKRSMQQQQQAQQEFAAYVQDAAGSGGAADQIAKAKTLLDSGAISQAEFDALKAKALQG